MHCRPKSRLSAVLLIRRTPLTVRKARGNNQDYDKNDINDKRYDRFELSNCLWSVMSSPHSKASESTREAGQSKI
jgi:hypothetical protein